MLSLRSGFRHPLVHFLLLGALLWLAHAAWRDYAFRVVDAPGEEALYGLIHDWQLQQTRIATDADVDTIRQLEIDQRILFREALRLGLHRADPVVLRRLRKDVEFLGIPVDNGREGIELAMEMELYTGDEVIRRRLLERMRALAAAQAPEPSDENLLGLYASTPERWEQPARLSFTHVYVRDSADAEARIKALMKTPDPELGDPFLFGPRFQAQTEPAIDRQFGPGFAGTLKEQPLNAWAGPIRSRYGWHLIHLTARESQAPRSFAEVRDQLRQQWLSEGAREQLQRWLRELRKRYRVTAA